jgi:signal transduction histidine kinase
LTRLRVTGCAAALGLLAGMTMTYVPWEFGASIFSRIYPHLRLLGCVYLLGGALITTANLYPDGPRAVRWAGRLLLAVGLGIYWWWVSIPVGGLTGKVIYPLMIAGILAEALPAFRSRGLFAPLLSAVGLIFGAMMWASPESFGALIYVQLQPFMRELGVVYLVGGAVLAWALAHRREGWARAAMGVVGLACVYVAFNMTGSRAWPGVALYGVLGACGLLGAGLQSLPKVSVLQLRLMRVLGVACVLPVLLLGAVASGIAQRAIQAQVQVNVEQAMASEVAWLANQLEQARTWLRLVAVDSSVAEQLAGQRPAGLDARLDFIERESGSLDSLWLMNPQGDPVAVSKCMRDVKANFAKREYFQRALAEPGIFVTQPFMGVAGQPVVVLSMRVEQQGRVVGVLAASIVLERLNKEVTPTSRAYEVQVMDVRDGGLLRDTRGGKLLSKVSLAPELMTGADGVGERFDTSGRPQLTAHARVPDSPWGVIIDQPLRRAYAPVARLSMAVVGTALLAALLGGLLAQLGARELVARLLRLKAAFAGRVGARPEADLGKGDELAALEAAFGRLAEEVDQTQQQLRAAVATREQFLSIASHELRTPLTALRATVEVLAKQLEASGREASAVARMRRQLDRLARLVADLLDVSRLGSGRFALELAPTDGLEVVREVVERLRLSQPALASRLRVELPGAPVHGQWDAQRVEQVVSNLLENAFRYSPEDRPVTLRVRPTEGRVRISVEDQGIGVPSESQGTLFKAFYRAPNASSMYAGGLGLGLSICREIVERHGGRIWVESEGAGKGSRFHAELPTQPPEESRLSA